MKQSLTAALLILFVTFGCDATKPDAKTESAETKTETEKTEKTRDKKRPKPAEVPSPKPTGRSPKPTGRIPWTLPRAQFEAGWVKLFDGRTLFGWTSNSDANWRIDNSVLTADKGKAGLLVTDVPFADFELKCEYRLAKGGNSGIFLRTAFQPTDPAVDCYELNICDTHKTHPTGSLVGRKVADVKTTGEGDWQAYHVIAKGNRITVTLDGKQVLDFTDESKNALHSGFIGLQFREGKIEFRNVLLKPLGGKPIFNAKNLAGWKPLPGADGKAKVADNAVHLKGKVFLQSENSWGDFVLQADVRTNAKNVNSGIFFRSMDGTQSRAANGYELQIHNGFADGDRTKPNDYKTGYGTGAIFRFQKARRVIPDDNAWFTLTLVAYGDRFASWVNGYQVTSWRDERKPNENPRRGRRLKPGRFILQGHDPGSDVSFRSLNVASYPTPIKPSGE